MGLFKESWKSNAVGSVVDGSELKRCKWKPHIRKIIVLKIHFVYNIVTLQLFIRKQVQLKSESTFRTKLNTHQWEIKSLGFIQSYHLQYKKNTMKETTGHVRKTGEVSCPHKAHWKIWTQKGFRGSWEHRNSQL